MTKIDIFSGFLGAGKTTLIKKLIAEAYAGEKLVLIENEFGEIGIDGGFLQDAGINITEMNSGCICCSLVGDFGKALRKVLDEYHPDRILIEPSGVGKLSDVIRAVEGVLSEDACLNAYTAVVDAAKCRMYLKNFGEFFGDQIAHASAVVLSHQGKLSDEKVAAAVSLIRESNPDAAIITTPWESLDGKDILAAIEKKDTLAADLARLAEEQHHHHDDEHEHHHHHGHECDDPHCDCHHHHDDEHEHHHHDHDHECDDPHCDCHHHHDEEYEHHHHDHDHECDDPHCDCHHHHDEEHEDDYHHDHDHECDDPHCDCHHHHHADEVFTSFGAETAKKFTAEEIKIALDALSEDTVAFGLVLRAKGIVAAEDGRWIHFDYVPGEPDVRYGTAGVTGRLCIIGSHIDREALGKLFGVELRG